MKVYIYGIVFDEVDCHSFECATLWSRDDVKEDHEDGYMIFSTIKDAEDVARSLFEEGNMVMESSSVYAWYRAWDDLIDKLLGDEFYMED